MPIKKSLYDITESQRDSIMHTGFNYEGKVFERSMSNFILKDDLRKGILDKMEAVVFYLIESVKSIKSHVHFGIKKDYKKFN